MRKLVFTLLALLFLLIACGGDSDPGAAVEQYLEAKVVGDADAVRGLLCSEMESVYEREIHTFDTVSDVEIEGMACAQVGDTAQVSCEGVIKASYGTEITEFPLVTYRVVEEDGEWKWCGEG